MTTPSDDSGPASGTMSPQLTLRQRLTLGPRPTVRRRRNEVLAAIQSVRVKQTGRNGDDTDRVRSALEAAQAATNGVWTYRQIDRAWVHVHMAQRESLTSASAAALIASATELRCETKTDKLSGWRSEAVLGLLGQFDHLVECARLVPCANRRNGEKDAEASPLEPEQVEDVRAFASRILIQAHAIRDEAVSNTYRRLSIRQDYSFTLLLLLVLVGGTLLRIVQPHLGDLRSLASECAVSSTRNKVAPAISASNNPTGACASSNACVASKPAVGVVSTPAAIDTVSSRCRDELMARSWILWSTILAGALGAVTSALQRASNDRSKGRVPELTFWISAALSRVGLGATAGFTLYLGLRSGAIEFPKFQVLAVALLGAFSFGFVERVFVIGEKPEKA